ncbi:DUF5818 domain-containing protein [Lutibaculum baratangense]|uniref:Gamma-D-glutamyl-L-diamino acid endopeptidase I n=1 Tax=Lutibaculum baratangense AMV1 TaxID=631454 RepID=V4R1H7_9HYPH|nr:DUF5818 domain-containing protein [Lutibaculum baratangense]ESR25837.1 gamma-D-glutamyl-L-diamino acid endopeptidase I [Lutibaculum baratangense AMV1]
MIAAIAAPLALLATACNTVPDGPPDGALGDGRAFEGRVSAGAECPILTTTDGRVYSLAGGGEAHMGERVRVCGTMAEMSFCMQGEGTISVESIEALPGR